MSRKSLLLLAVGVAIAAFALLPTHQASASPSESYGYGQVHCVRFGETLFGIGRMYGVSPWAIAAANGIANPNFIRAGQCLTIPGHGHVPPHYPPPHPPKWPPHPACYWVMPGDTLYSIGMRFGVSPWSIAHANGIVNPNFIRAGQCLKIPRW